MSDREQRKPRETFTRALVHICEALDKQNTHEIHWKDRYLGRSCRGLMRAESLWVVGSYARGALTCGDLDLVLKLVRVEGIHGEVSRFVRTAFRRSPGVRFYEGDPEENTSGVSFPEAVQIWRPEGNWRSAIESIALDPNATRFSRPTDEFPLRVEQMYAEVDDIEALLERRRSNEIDWRFLPVDPEQPPASGAADWEETVLRYLSHGGKDTRRLLPYVLEYLRTNAGQLHSRISYPANTTELQVEGTFIGMGRPRVNLEKFDTPEVSRVLLIPHLSRPGPNGILELRRGAAHPLEARSRNLRAHVLYTKDGVLLRECYVARIGGECELVNLFQNIQHAREYIACEQEAGDPDLLPVLLTGGALLEVLSCADALDVHRTNGDVNSLILTHMGRVVFGEHDESVRIASVDEVLDTIA